MAGQSFAEASDVEAVWHSLNEDERAAATKLLSYASNMLRLRWPDIDTRIANEDLTAETAEQVVVSMVVRAMISRSNPGVSQINQVAGPFNEGLTFANPNGNLYIGADEARMIEGVATGRAFSVDLAPDAGLGYYRSDW